jgi:DNA polymerase III epsilon subunit-like protein
VVATRAVGTNPLPAAPFLPPYVITTVSQDPSINWEKVLYVVFDLETTGRLRNKDEIIELAAIVLDKFGVPIEDAQFVEYVKPTTRIPPFITELTTITNDDVKNAGCFTEVAGAFIRFIQQQADDNEGDIQHIVMVGHNSKAFDIPFFLQLLCANNIADTLFSDKRFGFGLDTMLLARKAVRDRNNLEVPSAYNLTALFQYVTGSSPITAHRALSDVNSTSTLLRFQPFWETRKQCVFRFSWRLVQEVETVEEFQAAATGTVADQVDDSSCENESVSSSGSSSSDDVSVDETHGQRDSSSIHRRLLRWNNSTNNSHPLREVRNQ